MYTLDIRAAARFLKVSPTSLRRWTEAGLLACLRVGGRRERRFRRSDLLAMLEVQAARPVALRVEEQPTRTTLIGGIPVPLGSHFCGFYDSDESRVGQAVGFLADGFGPGEWAFLFAAPDIQAAVLNRLAEVRSGVQALLEAGRFTPASYAPSADEQVRFVERSLLAATRSGARAIRSVGDVSGSPLGTAPAAVALEFERAFDERLARRFPVVTLCQYDVRTLSGAEAIAQLRVHSDTFDYPPARVLG